MRRWLDKMNVNVSLFLMTLVLCAMGATIINLVVLIQMWLES